MDIILFAKSAEIRKNKAMGEIYKIINDINDYIYVGKTTKTMITRKREHLKQLNDGTDIHNAILELGLSHFSWELIESNIYDNQVLAEREKYWIQYYNSYKNGYNMTPGGEGGNGTYAKNLKIWREQNKEQVEKNIQILLDWQKNHPEEVKVAHEKTVKTIKEKYGKNITRAANETTKKKVLCIETNIIYNSATDAAKQLGHSSGAHIGQVCNNQRKTAFGYHWIWLKNEED